MALRASALQGLAPKSARPAPRVNAVGLPKVAKPLQSAPIVTVANSRSQNKANRDVKARIAAPEQAGQVQVSINNDSDSSCTVIKIQAANKPGMLSSLTSAFRFATRIFYQCISEARPSETPSTHFKNSVTFTRVLENGWCMEQKQRVILNYLDGCPSMSRYACCSCLSTSITPPSGRIVDQ